MAPPLVQNWCQYVSAADWVWATSGSFSGNGFGEKWQTNSSVLAVFYAQQKFVLRALRHIPRRRSIANGRRIRWHPVCARNRRSLLPGATGWSSAVPDDSSQPCSCLARHKEMRVACATVHPPATVIRYGLLSGRVRDDSRSAREPAGPQIQNDFPTSRSRDRAPGGCLSNRRAPPASRRISFNSNPIRPR